MVLERAHAAGKTGTAIPPQHFLSAVAKEYDPQYDASYPHDPVSVSTCQTLDHQSFSIVAGVSPNLSKPSSTHARALSQSAYSKLPFFATLGAELARVPGLPRPIEPLFPSVALAPHLPLAFPHHNT